MPLSKEAKTVLYTLYKEYLNRRRHNVSKTKSKNFISAKSIHETFFPNWDLSDVEDALRELDRNNFMNNFYADGTIYECCLSDNAIVVMENQKQETLLNLVDFISKFIP